jgi:cytochrome c oxidase assembly factor CtaG
MTPLGVGAVLGAVLSILAFSRRRERSRRVHLQLLLALASFGLLWFATSSSFAHEGMMNLPKHMIGHILVMFIVPIGIVGSGFFRSLWWLLDVRTRRRVLRWWFVERTWHAPRWLVHPLTAGLVLNVVMVTAHTPPRIFDFMMIHTWGMDWLMEPAFFLSGLFFFHFLVPSPPRRMRTPVRFQLVMLLATVAEMFFLAMAMSIFSKTSWYWVLSPSSAMPYMPGMATTAKEAFSQQQLAAGILWICGDFWAGPLLVYVVLRGVKKEGSLMALLERQASRLSGAPV